MPTYQYACTDCGDRSEVVQRFTDDPLTVCSVCGGKLRKVFSPVGIVFKGSGFYRTDSRNGSVPPAKDGAKETAAKDGAAKDGAAKDGVAKDGAAKDGAGSGGSAESKNGSSASSADSGGSTSSTTSKGSGDSKSSTAAAAAS